MLSRPRGWFIVCIVQRFSCKCVHSIWPYFKGNKFVIIFILFYADQLKNAEFSTPDIQHQISTLKDRLSADQLRLHQKQEEIDTLRRKLIIIVGSSVILCKLYLIRVCLICLLYNLVEQLSEAQLSYKQAHNEAEQLRSEFLWKMFFFVCKCYDY